MLGAQLSSPLGRGAAVAAEEEEEVAAARPRPEYRRVTVSLVVFGLSAVRRGWLGRGSGRAEGSGPGSFRVFAGKGMGCQSRSPTGPVVGGAAQY